MEEKRDKFTGDKEKKELQKALRDLKKRTKIKILSIKELKF